MRMYPHYLVNPIVTNFLGKYHIAFKISFVRFYPYWMNYNTHYRMSFYAFPTTFLLLALVVFLLKLLRQQLIIVKIKLTFPCWQPPSFKVYLILLGANI